MREATQGSKAIPHRGVLMALFGFIAVTALGGSAELIGFASTGTRYVPLSLLAGTPFATFWVPGLLLLAVGMVELTALLALWRRSPVAGDLALLGAGAIAIWILSEMAILRQFHPLHGLYLVLSCVALVAAIRGAWQSQAPRLRWTVGVTVAEGIGFLGPVLVGVLATPRGLSELERGLALTCAGLWEGTCLGLGQALLLPLPLGRVRFAALTALGGGLVWASVMGLMGLARSGLGPGILIPASLTLGCAALLLMGSLQWLELRRLPKAPALGLGAMGWVGWTALAWLVALPLSFSPSPLVDEKTPLAANLCLWVCGGLLMAYALSLLTWQGARRLLRAG